MNRVCALVCLLAAAVQAQQLPFSVGAIGGIRVTNDIVGPVGSPPYPSESRRYVIGPTVELFLPWQLSIEFNALYRRTGFRSRGEFVGFEESRYRANTWEFPILAKYRIPFERVQPFFAAGYSPRVMNGHFDAFGLRYDFEANRFVTYERSASWSGFLTHGAVFGSGVELALKRLHFVPQVRYTRWSSDAIRQTPRRGVSAGSALNQVDLLLAITFR